ncbi:hypothetical protein M5E82_14680 [Parabacteroides distasonis]|nr:hypothetical protein M5E82_14680 [Parabacteroides distasonis]
MLRIITHIERLLLTHDCVILPKFGGFVLQTLPATYQEEEHLFRPMRKEVMFNVTLQHTDGLLSESYMQTYGVDYRKAQLMLEEDIEALNVSLEQDKRITLGRIGTFSIGEEGQTILRRAILGYSMRIRMVYHRFIFRFCDHWRRSGKRLLYLRVRKRKMCSISRLVVS